MPADTPPSLDQTTNHTDSTRGSRPKPRRSLFRRILTLVLGVALITGIWLPIGIFWYVRYVIHRTMNVEQIAAFRKWQKDKVVLPPEAMEVLPFEPGTIAASEAYRQQWDAQKSAVLDFLQKHPVTADGRTIASLAAGDLDPFESLLAAHARLVRASDYEIMALAAGSEPLMEGLAPGPSLDGIAATAKLLMFRVSIKLREGDHRGALANTFLIFKTGRANPYDAVIVRLMAVSFHRLGVGAMHEILASNPDPKLLTEALEFQKLIAQVPSLIHPVGFRCEMPIGILREAKRRGIEVKTDGLSAQGLLVEGFRAAYVYEEKFIIPKLSNPDERQERLNAIRKFYESDWVMRGEWRITKGVGGILPSEAASAVLYNIPIPNYREAKTRENWVRARLELTMMDTAQTLFRAQHGSGPTILSELVPGILADLPKDPFSPDHKFYIEIPKPHSVGPDQEDQHASLLYDPTNGAVSAGDIFMDQD